MKPRDRVLRIAAGAAVAAATLLLGCAGGSGGAPQPTGPRTGVGAVSSAQVETPAQFSAIDLRGEPGGATVDLVVDRAVLWSSYRDSDEVLILEFSNSEPLPDVVGYRTGEGFLASVEVERLADAERPLTRLIIETRGASEHDVVPDEGLVRIHLAPSGQRRASVVAAEPLPDGAGGEGVGGTGTPDQPYVAPGPTGVAATQLMAVQVGAAGGTTIVEVLGDGEFAYSTFRLENPDRFVVDLTGVVNTAPRSTVPVGSDIVDQVRVGQFKPRPEPVSRVVFDLHGPVTPFVERTSDGLRIHFGGEGPTGTTLAEEVASATGGPDEEIATLAEPARYEESAAAPPEEPVVVELAEVPPGEVPPAEPSEFPMVDTTYADEQAPPEVADSAPSIPSAEPLPPAMPPPQAPPPPAGAPSVAGYFPTSDVELLEAQRTGEAEASEDEEAVLPQFEALVVRRHDSEYRGDPITMTLKDADLVEVLRSFAKLSDLNFVIQPGVSGSVTVELHNVPWDQAMHQILKINNLGMDIDGTIVRIAPMEQLRAEVEEERRLQAARQQSVSLTTMIKALSYADAGTVAGLLRSRTGAILSSRGTVQVDSRTNQLIIRELPGHVDVVLAVIESLDTPPPQVTIEARIIEATKQFGRSLGISWGFDGVADQRHGNTTGIEFPNNIATDGGVSLLTGGANGFLNLSLGNVLNTFTLDASLIAAESEGLVNVISAPRVTTLNNTRASIQSGLQIPVQTVSNRTVTVQFVNATLQLQVTPHVTAEGTILMDINVAKREPQLAFAVVGASNAPIATKEAQTRVIVRDGGTAVIGGIYEVTSNQNEDRVPGLANVPIIKHLFKNRNRSEQNEELMIFITPRIVQM